MSFVKQKQQSPKKGLKEGIRMPSSPHFGKVLKSGKPAEMPKGEGKIKEKVVNDLSPSPVQIVLIKEMLKA